MSINKSQKNNQSLDDESKLESYMHALEMHRYGLITDYQLKEAKKRYTDPKYSVSSIKLIIEQNDDVDERHIQQIKSLKDRIYKEKTSLASHIGPAS